MTALNYRVARDGVEIGEFEPFNFFEAVNSGVIRREDSFWMEGMTEWKPVASIFESQATLQHSAPPSNNANFVELPRKEKRAETLKNVLGVAGGTLLWILWLGAVVLVLVFGSRLAVWLEPWVQALSGIALLVVVPCSLLFLIAKRTRFYGGVGIYYASLVIGLSLWITCIVYALRISVFWTLLGVMMGGLGIVPIAAIMTLIRRDWSGFGSIVLLAATVYGLRLLGLWIAGKYEEYANQQRNVAPKKPRPAVSALRWIVALPAAIGSYGLANAIAMLFSGLAGDSSYHVGHYASALISPIAFIYVGAMVAPSRRSATAVVLTVLYTILLAGLWGFLAFRIMNGYAAENVTEPAIQAVISVIVTVVCCVRIIQTDRDRFSFAPIAAIAQMGRH